MILRCLLAVVVMSFCLTSPSSAEDKPEREFADDTRLDVLLNIQATGTPLDELLADISAKTGVKMTCKREVADDKVFIRVKELPLHKLQHALKEVLHLKCTRSGKKGEWKYEFWMDLKTQQEADLLRAKEIKRLRDYLTKLVNGLNLSAAEVEKKYADDPMADYELQNQLSRTFLTVYSQIPADQLNALWRDRALTIRGDQLSDTLWDALLDALQVEQESADAQWDMDEFGDDEMAVSSQEWKKIDRIEMTISDTGDFGPEWGVECHGEMTMQSADGESFTVVSSTISTFSPGSDWEEIASGINPDVLGAALSEEEIAAAMKRFEEEEKIELKIERPVDSYQLLALLSEEAKIGIVSDYFTCVKRYSYYEAPFTESLPKPLLLGVMGMMMESTVSQEEDLAMFSARMWPLNREREIPERMVRRWKSIRDKHGSLGMSEALELAQLRDVQLDDLHLYGLGYSWEIKQSKGLLKFLGTLTADQWARIQSRDGLFLAEIPPDQYALLYDWSESGDWTTIMLASAASEDEDGYEQDPPQVEAISVRKAVMNEDGEQDSNSWLFEVHAGGNSASTGFLSDLGVVHEWDDDAEESEEDEKDDEELLVEVVVKLDT